jgi:hypothetical protein
MPLGSSKQRENKGAKTTQTLNYYIIIKEFDKIIGFRIYLKSISCSLITIDRNKILGFGAYGVVFEGTWNEKKVAVKRIQIATSESNKQEEEALQKLDHPNIVKLFHVQIDADFR